MKMLTVLFVLSAGSVSSRPLTIESPGVGSAQTIVMILQFDDSLSFVSDPSAFRLVAPGNEQIPASAIVVIGRRMRLVFGLTGDNFVIFERLTRDSSGYYLDNAEPINAGRTRLEAGELRRATENRIPCIDKHAWESYILGAYASAYYFRHEFSFGTNLGTAESTATVYYLEFAQSDHYFNSTNLSLLWGIKGRWSTGGNDRLNYAQIYPIVLALTDPVWKISLAAGVECGYRGFTKQGEGSVRGEVQYRLPYNPVDMTFGARRWRLNPVLTFSLNANAGWSEILLPDSLKRCAALNAGVRYDIPVGKIYYLRTNALAEYATATRQLQYRYAFSFGYIADGTVRIMLEYRQGYQPVSYAFDKQLVCGVAIDGFNQSGSK
jgi:hypothetical protein